MNDPIVGGLQSGIDRDRTGWTVTNYVAIVGLSRINDDGYIETTSGVYYADGQPDYTTKGLMNKGYDLLEEAADAERRDPE